MAWSDMASGMLGTVVDSFNYSDTPAMYFINTFTNERTRITRAVFDTASITVDPETGAPVSSSNPVLGLVLSDLEFVPNSKDHEVEISGVAYKIDDLRRDGVAGLTLYLKKIRVV